MEKTDARAEGLQFIFTEKDFYLDTPSLQEESGENEWRIRFEADRYYALYQMGFEERSENPTATGSFLYLVSDTFLRCLTRLPELELAREKVNVKPLAEDVEALLRALPFAIGAEHVDGKWIAAVFRRLLKIFREEISAYRGTVEMYLTEKSQHLHVPERIFFHLVENKGDEYPFAFLATYATRGTDGKVRHVPLKYALTEYKDERDKLLKLLSCLNRVAEVSELIGPCRPPGRPRSPVRPCSSARYSRSSGRAAGWPGRFSAPVPCGWSRACACASGIPTATARWIPLCGADQEAGGPLPESGGGYGAVD